MTSAAASVDSRARSVAKNWCKSHFCKENVYCIVSLNRLVDVQTEQTELANWEIGKAILDNFRDWGHHRKRLGSLKNAKVQLNHTRKKKMASMSFHRHRFRDSPCPSLNVKCWNGSNVLFIVIDLETALPCFSTHLTLLGWERTPCDLSPSPFTAKLTILIKFSFVNESCCKSVN